MKRSFTLLAIAGCALVASTAGATVTVTFDKPENFTDMPFTAYDRDTTLRSLQQHFEKLGSRLPAGQDFKVEVMDVDLAGRIKPSVRAPMDLRVLTGGADWPSIKLRYAVEANGAVVKSGETIVSDMNYLYHANRYFEGEALRYEKQMLDDWFKRVIQVAR